MRTLERFLSWGDNMNKCMQNTRGVTERLYSEIIVAESNTYLHLPLIYTVVEQDM